MLMVVMSTVNNPPIQPPSSEFKPNAILSIRDKDLQVINSHLSFPDKGLIFRLENQASDIVLVPRRRDALKHIQKQDDDSITLCNAFDEVEKKVKATQARWSHTQSIVREDTQHKYICVGNQTNRGGVGIRRYHRALLECPRHIQSRIMHYFKSVEHFFTMFMDTEEIRIIRDAIELMQSETVTIPQNFASSNFKLHTEEDHIEKAAIYGAFACGVNVYLASHTVHRC